MLLALIVVGMVAAGVVLALHEDGLDMIMDAPVIRNVIQAQ